MKKVVVAWAKRDLDTSESETACPADWKLPKPMPRISPAASRTQLLLAWAIMVRERAVSSRAG